MRKVKLLDINTMFTHNSYPFVRVGIPKDAQELYVGAGAILYRANDGKWYARTYMPDGLLSDVHKLSPVLDDVIEMVRKFSDGAKLKGVKLDMGPDKPFPRPPGLPSDPYSDERPFARGEISVYTDKGAVIFPLWGDYLAHPRKKEGETYIRKLTDQITEVRHQMETKTVKQGIVFVRGEVASPQRSNFIGITSGTPVAIKYSKITGVASDSSTGAIFTFVRNTKGVKGKRGAIKLQDNTLFGAILHTNDSKEPVFYPVTVWELKNQENSKLIHYNPETKMAKAYKIASTELPDTYTPINVEFDMPRELASVVVDVRNSNISTYYDLLRSLRYEEKAHPQFRRAPKGLSLPVGVFAGQFQGKDAIHLFYTSKPQYLLPHKRHKEVKERFKAVINTLIERGIYQLSILGLPEGLKPDNIAKAKIALQPYLWRKLVHFSSTKQTAQSIGLYENTKTLFLITKDGKVYASGTHGFLTGDTGDLVSPTSVENEPHAEKDQVLHDADFIALKQIDLGDKIHDVEALFSTTNVPVNTEEWSNIHHLNTLHGFLFRGENGAYLVVKGRSVKVKEPFESCVYPPDYGSYNQVIEGEVEKDAQIDEIATHYIHLPDKDAIVVPHSGFHLVGSEQGIVSYRIDNVAYAPNLGYEAGFTVILPNHNKAFIITPPSDSVNTTVPKSAIPLDKLAEMFPFKEGETAVSPIDLNSIKEFVPNPASHFGKAVILSKPIHMKDAVCKV